MIYDKNFDYSFDENACKNCDAKCCTGASGYIYANLDEIEKLRAKFKLSFKDFEEKYLLKVNGRYSFKEYKYQDGFACVFFDELNKNCSIYELRPEQCKTFPFWNYFKTHKKELKKECIGVCF